ncbi:stress enhanced protein 1, chloroplastic [Iris pallida]|uniref:Stress enhanced protein 1, chloroplastic n=1 Tax=Iris pallida TaxID=29817 RepID=A0AAX6EJA8_IRIPA|nr:stress enhanced protein 1, chloroplastic [Iris pallida]
MAQAHISSPPISLLNAIAVKSARPYTVPLLSRSSVVASLASSFKSGAPLNLQATSRKRNPRCQAKSISIRCEQGAKQSKGLDVWLGRFAMVGFATAITVEVATGKGLLENFGFVTPIPTLALVVTALVGVLTAFFIFQSASQS